MEHREKTNIIIHLNKIVIWGIVFISLFGVFFHFLYEISGKLLIIGFISPVNESVWEHLKLAFFPSLIWWTISYFVLSKKYYISINKWLFATSISLVVSPLIIVFLYYTATAGLGLESVILDIFYLFISVVVAQKLFLYTYQNIIIKKHHLYLSIFVILFMFSLFIIFTISPPHLPIFLDNTTGTYGV